MAVNKDNLNQEVSRVDTDRYFSHFQYSNDEWDRLNNITGESYGESKEGSKKHVFRINNEEVPHDKYISEMDRISKDYPMSKELESLASEMENALNGLYFHEGDYVDRIDGSSSSQVHAISARRSAIIEKLPTLEEEVANRNIYEK
ncbi:MAG: hypothetical protein N4A47_00055 [Clostridia bacterium]|jgi:hypothetical protein|nr:hypothetical protein [Clostridia bacterium]